MTSGEVNPPTDFAARPPELRSCSSCPNRFGTALLACAAVALGLRREPEDCIGFYAVELPQGVAALDFDGGVSLGAPQGTMRVCGRE